MTPAEATIDALFGPEDEQLEQALDLENFNRQSVYNVPGYRPVFSELRNVPVRVSGQIPADLRGVYLRNGANVQFAKQRARVHPFNGPGMLHQVQIQDGEVTYSNCFVRTPRYAFEASVGREAFAAFSDHAGGGKVGLARMQMVEKKKQKGLIPNLSAMEASTASTSVRYHEGRLYCLNETAYPFALNARRENGRLVLDGTGRLETWNGQLQSPFSAHPRIDPVTGTFYNLSIDRLTGDICYSRLERGQLADHRVIHRQDMASGTMAYLHDYVVTDRWLVFPDTSLRNRRERMLGSTGSPYYFDCDRKMRWGVLPREPREGDEVRWFETAQPGFVWHLVNGWETVSAEGQPQIVLYAPMFDDYPADIPIHSPSEPHAKLHKWVLDLATGRVVVDRRLLDHPYERPTIATALSGQETRYAYLLDESGGYMGQGVLKYDLSKDKPQKYFGYGDSLGGEALFVPKVGGIEEDDGYLVDLLMRDDAADLVVIDARTMTELARVHLPGRVPFGVHACLLDTAQVDALIGA